MGARVDLSGRRYGSLVVDAFDHKDSKRRSYWRCTCDCGEETVVRSDQLNDNSSCSCKRKPDLVGQAFGKLTVAEKDHEKNNDQYWRCLCACGAEVIAATRSLRSGNTRSCGCGYKHGGHNKVHGMCESAEYTAWRKLRAADRCPTEWNDFARFLLHVGSRPDADHFLSRRDNRLPHSKSNTYWRLPNDTDDIPDAGYGYIDLDTGTYCLPGTATQNGDRSTTEVQTEKRAASGSKPPTWTRIAN